MGLVYIRVDALRFHADLTRTVADLLSTVSESSSIHTYLPSKVAESPSIRADLASV